MPLPCFRQWLENRLPEVPDMGSAALAIARAGTAGVSLCQSRRNWGPFSRREGAKPRADESRRNGGQVGGRRWKEWNSGSGVIRLERGDANRR
jgi:hypothetical protein